jgi:hypothetical protein
MKIREKETGTASASKAPLDHPPMIQLFVFRGEEYLGWDCFCQEKITVGSCPDADLFLDDRSLDEMNAVIFIDMQGRLKAAFLPSGQENPDTGNTADAMVITPLDTLVIGPYSLKAKMSKNGKSLGDRTLSRETQAAVTQTPESQTPAAQPAQNPPEEPAPSVHGREAREEEEARTEMPAITDVQERHVGTFDLFFEGKLKENCSPEEVKKNLSSLFKRDPGSLDKMFSGKKVRLKRGADYQAASALQSLLEDAGAVCSIEASRDETPASPLPAQEKASPAGEPAPAGPADPGAGEAAAAGPREDAPWISPLTPGESGAWKTTPYDEDEDDDDEPASFSLKEMIRNSALPSPGEKARGAVKQTLLEVVKSRADSIIDVRFLDAGEKYFVRLEKGWFCLAENKGSGEISLYLDDPAIEVLGREEAGGAGVPREDMLPGGERISSRSMQAGESVVLRIGFYEYLLRKTAPSLSPRIKEAKKDDEKLAGHFGRSVAFHVLLFVILGMMPTYKPDPVDHDGDRFAKVDTRQLEEIMKASEPPQIPRKSPEIMKLKPEDMVQRVVKMQPVEPSPEHRAAVPSSASAKVASARTASSGGGNGTGQGSGNGSGSGNGNGNGGEQGPGNVSTRDVHQAGILSMIGDNVGIKPQEAMAAVTNLDAVSSPAEGRSQFKVGGLVGKVDGGRIEIPKSGIVSTKGSSQVLRSGGGNGGPGNAGGSGTGGPGGGEVRVAALDKGSTGSHQVKAKVTAQLSKTVKIQGGGMSREEVKRIIDQHLDEITHCYETALVANPSLMGRVVFEWKILMSGRVGEVRIKSSTLNSPEIHSCIQSAIKSWEFPQPDGSEVVVSYPFIFDIVGF